MGGDIRDAFSWISILHTPSHHHRRPHDASVCLFDDKKRQHIFSSPGVEILASNDDRRSCGQNSVLNFGVFFPHHIIRFSFRMHGWRGSRWTAVCSLFPSCFQRSIMNFLEHKRANERLFAISPQSVWLNSASPVSSSWGKTPKAREEKTYTCRSEVWRKTLTGSMCVMCVSVRCIPISDSLTGRTVTECLMKRDKVTAKQTDEETGDVLNHDSRSSDCVLCGWWGTCINCFPKIDSLWSLIMIQ